MNVEILTNVKLEDEIMHRNSEKTMEFEQILHVRAGARFLMTKIKDKLSMEATIIIKGLYDLNGNEVPKAKWIDHNVLICE